MSHPKPRWLELYELKKGQHLSKSTEFKPTAKWVDLPCKICGNLVHLTENKAEKFWAGYCSKVCCDKTKKTGLSKKVICQFCGNEFRTVPARNPKFCSNECRGKSRRKSWAYQDKHLRQSWQYKEWKAKVNIKDNFKCKDCGKESDIAHHIKNWHEFPELRFDVENGKTLCRKCHIKIHINDLH
jgi:hypothetical protein